MKIISKAALCAIAAFLPAMAHAVTIAPATYDFSGSFSNPKSVEGSFTTSYDTATSSFTLDAISLTVDGYVYNLKNTGVLTMGSTLYLGGIVNRVNGVSAFTSSNDFEAIFGFDAATGALTKMSNFSLLAPTTRAIEHDLHPSFSLEAVVSPAPEPGIWTMMILGFGTVGGVLRSTYRRSEARFTRKVRSLAAA